MKIFSSVARDHPPTSAGENLAGAGDTAMSVHISLRLMSDQLDRLHKVAEARGLSRSHALRRLIDEASLTPDERSRLPDTDELLALLIERARAGNVAASRALLDRMERNADVDRERSEFDELDGSMEYEHVNEGRRHGG